jgi:subtilisin family serine protease
VAIAAPGANIYATSVDGTYTYMSGTSMATPVVTGAAALMQSLAMSRGRTLKGWEIKKFLMDTADRTPDAAARTQSGRLNVGKAVRALLATLPPAPTPPKSSPPPAVKPSPPPPTNWNGGRSVTPPACGKSIIKGAAAKQSTTAPGRPAEQAVNGNCKTMVAKNARACSQTGEWAYRGERVLTRGRERCTILMHAHRG